MKLIDALRPMQWLDLFATREQMIKQSLYAEFGSSKKMMTRIDAAVERGLASSKPHAIAVFGQQAKKFFEHLDQEMAQRVTPEDMREFRRTRGPNPPGKLQALNQYLVPPCFK